MIDNFGLKEVWLPTEEAMDQQQIAQTPSKLDKGKRVKFGSKSLARSTSAGYADDDRRSDDGDSRSEESEAPLSWISPPRGGVFTIDEQDLPRVSAEAMIKHARCNVYISENFWTCERLLVIVQGAGMIRPGQWSRSLCITHSIHAGSIIDYLFLAKETNMGVIVLNPNQNELKLRIRAADTKGLGTMNAQHVYAVPGHNTHISHVLSIFDAFISKCSAKEMYFVGNGRGGDTIMQLLNNRLEGTPIAPPSLSSDSNATMSNSTPGSVRGTPNAPLLKTRRTKEFAPNGLKEKLRAIAFINSAHTSAYANSEVVKTVIEEKSVHWVLSALPLDTVVPEQDDMFGCTCVSAGHSKADFASACAANSVFRFFFGRTSSNNSSSEQNGSLAANGDAGAGSFANGATSNDIPSFTPRVIPFSNPPQLNKVEKLKDINKKKDPDANGTNRSSGSEDEIEENDSEIGESDTRVYSQRTPRLRSMSINSSRSRSSTKTPRLVEPPVSSSSAFDRNTSSSSSFESHHHPTHWARRRYPPNHEMHDPLIDLVEMIEMGTQTENLAPQLPSSSTEGISHGVNGTELPLPTLSSEFNAHSQTTTSENGIRDSDSLVLRTPEHSTSASNASHTQGQTCVHFCAWCRFSHWITDTKSRSFFALALIGAGAVATRYLLLKRNNAFLRK